MFRKYFWFLVSLLALAYSSQPGRADPSGVVPNPRTQVFALGQVDQPPKLMVTFKTVYPPALKGTGISGEVTVECVVDLDGVVRDPVVKSSTQKEFELPALQSVVKWKYRPGRKAKSDVNVRMEILVKFDAKGK